MQAFLYLHQFSDWALLLLRFVIAVIFIVHGTAKWRMHPGGRLSPPMMNLFRLLSFVEPLGGIALLLGFLTQLAAAGLTLIMVGAILFKTGVAKKGFSSDGGWEFDFILLAANITLFFVGAGAISLDRVWLGI